MKDRDYSHQAVLFSQFRPELQVQSLQFPSSDNMLSVLEKLFNNNNKSNELPSL
jgi:hypothetical protein